MYDVHDFLKNKDDLHVFKQIVLNSKKYAIVFKPLLSLLWSRFVFNYAS